MDRSALYISNPLCLTNSLSTQTNIEAVEWVRYANAGETPNLICVYMGPKFETPHNDQSGSSFKKRARPPSTVSRVMVTAPRAKGKAPDALPAALAPAIPAPTGMVPLDKYC